MADEKKEGQEPEKKEALDVKGALANLKSQFDAEIKKQIDAAKAGHEEEKKTAEAKIKEIQDQAAEMQKQLDAFELKSKEQPVAKGNFRDLLLKTLEENKTAIAAAADHGAAPARLKVAATTIGTGNFGTDVVLGLREPGINEAPMRRRFLLGIINTMNGGPGTNPLTWIEWRPGNGGPAGVLESATKPGMDWTYVEGKQTAEVIAVTAATTKQALLNLTVLAQEINNELLMSLADELDRQILLGDGTSPNLKGIDQYAQAFTGSSLAGAVEDANLMDVLRAGILQVRKGNRATAGYTNRTGFLPNYILISPDRAAEMDLLKDNQGRYLLPPFITNDGQTIKGVRIIENDYVADDDFYIGDFTKSLFNFVEGLNIQTGWINDQFVKNQISIRAEVFGMHRIKYHDQWAFVKGDFTTAKALIQATT